jgi:phosphate/sulfate permease
MNTESSSDKLRYLVLVSLGVLIGALIPAVLLLFITLLFNLQGWEQVISSWMISALLASLLSVLYNAVVLYRRRQRK